MRVLRASEWKALGLGGAEGSVLGTGIKDRKSEAVARAAKHAEQRRATQDQYEQQYQAALGNIKQKLQVWDGCVVGWVCGRMGVWWDGCVVGWLCGGMGGMSDGCVVG